MALDTAIVRTTHTKLEPFKYPERATRTNVNVGPSQTIAAGTCLGIVTTSANDVQTITVSGTSGGTYTGSLVLTFTIDGVTATYTITLAANAWPTQAAIQTGIRALSIFTAGTVTVTGTLTTSTINGTIILTYTGFLAARPIPVVTTSNTIAGGTPVVAVVHTTTGVTGNTVVPYVDANTDGSGVGKYLAEYDMTTDSQGLITMGLANTGGFVMREKHQVMAVFTGGIFRSEDCVGLDAAFLTDTLGHLISGTTTTGEFQF